MSENERKSMIRVRGGFSEKIGINPCNTQMQITEFDKRTRTFISNKLYDFLQITFNNECETRNIKYGPSDQNLSNIFCKNLMQNVFADSNHLPLGYHYDWERFYSRIEAVLMDAPYNEVLDLLGIFAIGLFYPLTIALMFFKNGLMSFFKMNMWAIASYLARLSLLQTNPR